MEIPTHNHNKYINNNKSKIIDKDFLSKNIINPTFLRRVKINKHFDVGRYSNILSIDPWHVNEDKIKYHSGYNDRDGNDFSPDKKLSLISYSKFVKYYHNNSYTVNLFERRNNKHFQSIIDEYNKKSQTTKFDIFEGSANLYEYEHYKAGEIQYKFMKLFNKYAYNGHNYYNSELIDRTKKDFIKRNIKNAFCIERRIYYNNNKLTRKMNMHKTICNETKYKLLLNNEKLKQSSKYLSKFISMKDSTQKPYNNEQPHTFKIPIESIWNFSYVEKYPNPYHIRTATSRFNNNRILSKSNRGRSEYVQNKSSLLKNKTNYSSNQNSHNKFIKSQNQISRKLSRLYKGKNKSTLVIESDEQYYKIIKDKHSYCKNKESYYRIHSLMRTNKVNIDSSCSNDTHCYKQFLIYRRNFSYKNPYKSISHDHQHQQRRSFSAKVINKIFKNNTSTEFKPTLHQKEITIKKRHQMMKYNVHLKNFSIEGKYCELVYIIY